MLNPNLLLTLVTAFYGPQAIQADLSRFQDGIGVPFGKELDYAQLRRQGKDHVRFVVRFRTEYPGQNRPPIFSADVGPVVREIREAQEAGLGVILATEATAQENRALFFRNVALDSSGRVRLREDDNFSRLDNGYRQLAAALRGVNSRLLMWEIFPEPGWAFRDTGPGEIVHNVDGGHDTDREEDVRQQLGSHAAQRRFATVVLMEFEDHVVPMIRDIAPNVTLMLGTPGYGSPTGPGVYQDCIPNRFPNTVFHLHSYGPREISHQGDKGIPVKGYSWPENNWKVKARGLSSTQINNIAYEFDNRPWNASGLADMFDEVRSWQRRFPGAVVHFAEFGCTASARDTQAGQAYIQDMKRLMDEYGFGHTEWRG